MDLSVGSHHFKLSLAALSGIALALVLAFRFFGGSTAGLDQWLASAKQEVTTYAAYHARLTALAAVASAHRSRALALARDSAQTHGRLDSLVAWQRTDAGKRDTGIVTRIVSACRATIASCEERAAAWRVADDADRARADLAELRAAKADSLVRAGIRVKGCTFLHFFGCPTREQTFFGGVVVSEGLRFLLTGKP